MDAFGAKANHKSTKFPGKPIVTFAKPSKRIKLEIFGLKWTVAEKLRGWSGPSQSGWALPTLSIEMSRL
ncbi:hypothetical protein PoB_006477000 [Plakobranchus ocellatus]|uniref:Uncharacterized protein n=1 Tax=Plakobranchus ocellatus TaxID=259542 RepID=A0AAV4D2Q8_9GAST|nr:hypothetical protein PoB_006477000 [Plakobranchus ocellatus]